MGGGAANAFHRPHRHAVGRITFTDAAIKPAEFDEHFRLVVDDIAKAAPRPGFKAHDLDTARCELLADSAAAGTGTDDDDYRVVVESKIGWHRYSPWFWFLSGLGCKGWAVRFG